MEAKQERRMSLNLQNDVKKSFKDVDSIDDLDFDQIDLVKGETPKDIKETCLKLCQDFLSGVWLQQSVDTVEVRRVSGGLTNQLYYCGLINKSENETTVPQEVAIRLYGPKYFDSCDNETNERLSDVIIGLLVSENNLGPKLYGIHESGQIQKWYKHQQFREELQNDTKLVKQVFESLARIHTLDVPVKKNTNWVTRLMDKSMIEAFEKFPIENEIDQYNCETLKSNDLRAEIEWTKGVLEKANSPIIFTHNDFRSSNLLVTEPNNELVVCDFEYGGYGHRGHDFISLIREWGRNPWDFKSMGELPPPDSDIRPLIEIYVKECIRIKGKSYADDPINSVDHILKESKIHLMNGMLFFTLFLMKNDENNNEFPMPRKVVLGFADLCFKAYFMVKEKLIKDNII